LKLQSAYIKEKEASDIFKETQNRVRSIALVHEKLHRSNDLAKIDFADYARSLASHLMRTCCVSTSAIELETKLECALLNVETSIPCGLIVNELVTNAIMHAFPEGKGTIVVEFCSLGENRYSLTVADNGVGMARIPDPKNGDRLGWQLIWALVDQLKAAVEITHQGVVRVKIAFQELRYKERGW